MLTPGTRLGAYEITGRLGEGGMGEVYRARDTRLNRDVAIKVLPDAFADDAERITRFKREAQLLAALNHPSIAAIYGIEGGALVLELVEGITLAERIDSGRLSVDDAVPIALQIAEALEAAHEKGVVHRDLKPANIKLTPDGAVKVLDFGLAKLLDMDTPYAPMTQSPTFTAQGTFAGMILGTAPYMSPEQARGRAVDKRTDIWAFGCVLFEMLSGTRAFSGDDVTETLGAIIHKDPPWQALPAGVPAHLHTLLRRCLQRNPKERLRDIGDARIELVTPAAAAPAATATTSRLAWSGWIVAAVVAGVAAVIAFTVSSRESTQAPPMARFQFSSSQMILTWVPPAVSPDGRHVAYFTREAFGRQALWVRSIDGQEPRRLTNASNVDGMLFWSPDSRAIAFASASVLRRIGVDGGSVTTVGAVPGGPGSYQGGAWSRGGAILIGSRSGLFQMVNGSAVAVSHLAEGDAMHAMPSFLPDGRRFVFLRAGRSGSDGFYAGSLDTPPEQQLSRRIPLEADAAELALHDDDDGVYVFYTRDARLLVRRFDPRALEPVGEPAVISEGVAASAGQSLFSAGNGTVAFHSAHAFGGTELRWFDRAGKDVGRVADRGAYAGLDVSPDGRYAVVERADPDTRAAQLWSIDLTRGVFTRVNPGQGSDIAPAVAGDGRLAFTQVSQGTGGLGDLYRRPLNGTGEPELLWQSPTMEHPNDWSPDGRFLIFDDHHPTQRQDLWLLSIDGARKPQPLLVTPADETLAQFSPDGNWIAYRSDESGRSEIYLRDVAPERSPAVGDQKWTLSRDGGDKPRWSADGKSVFYIGLDRMMTKVPLVISGTTVQPGAPVPLFEVNSVGFTPYDVTPDERFLVTAVADQEGQSSTPVTVVVNWQRLLSRSR
jgi:serine/threonine protein kinase